MSTGTMPSGNTATHAKLCRKCGRDITHQRRLKDAQGNYWCSDCGVPTDSAGSGSGLISPCPKCHAPTHAAHMIRKDGVYVCEACANGTSKRGRKRSAVHVDVSGSGLAGIANAPSGASREPLNDDDDDARRKRNLAILGVLMILAGGMLFYFLNG